MNNKNNTLQKIKLFTKNYISPYLNQHQGDIKIIDLDKNNTLLIKLTGNCQKCPVSHFTLKEIIKKKIITKFKNIKKIKYKNKFKF